MLLELIDIIVPVFITVGIGFLWARLKFGIDPTFISRIVINVGSPALIFHGLTTMNVNEGEFWTLVLIATLLLFLMMAVNAVVLMVLKRPLADWLQPLTFPNWGNLGLPLSLFAFGEDGLALAIAFYAVSSTLQLTLGLLMVSGSMKPTLLLRMPVIYSVALALAFVSLDARPPQWLLNTSSLIGGMMIPMMLISLGASLAELKVTRLGEAGAFMLYRYFLGLGIAVGLAFAFGLEGPARGVVIIQGAMPIAVLNYLLAARFARMPGFVASMVVLSTLLSFLLIPIVLLFLL